MNEYSATITRVYRNRNSTVITALIIITIITRNPAIAETKPIVRRAQE